MNRTAGFTLVEVMVAVAVVAVALPALLVVLYQQVEGTGYLRDKLLAQMVAANRVVEIRILAESTRRLPEGSVSGMTEMAEREWHWTQTSSATELANFQRIEIQVGLSEDEEASPLITLVAFLSSDLAEDATTGTGSE